MRYKEENKEQHTQLIKQVVPNVRNVTFSVVSGFDCITICFAREGSKITSEMLQTIHNAIGFEHWQIASGFDDSYLQIFI